MGCRCAYCTQKLGNNGTRDHIIPRAIIKQMNTIDFNHSLNVIPSCRRCNQRKAARIVIPNPWDELSGLYAKMSPEYYAQVLADFYTNMPLIRAYYRSKGYSEAPLNNFLRKYRGYEVTQEAHYEHEELSLL